MTIFFVALVVTFSGFINSLTGFGFIIVAAPFLVQFLHPKEAASVALVLGIILAGFIALRERKTIAMKITLFMQNNAGWNNSNAYGAVTYYNNSGNVEDITISNCTFLGNRSKTDGSGWGGALHNRGANLTIANSIFWDNGTYGIYSEDGNAAISYSDVQGGLTSTGFSDGGNNITDDPGFAAGEYHLPLGSPWIDQGSNAAAADHYRYRR